MESDQPGMSDADNGYVGAILSGAFATMVDPVSDIVRDQANGTPGYAILFDPDGLVNINRSEWLPWLAQFVGDSQAVLGAPDVPTKQAIIKAPLNFTRGRPTTIVAAALGHPGARELARDHSAVSDDRCDLTYGDCWRVGPGQPQSDPDPPGSAHQG
jgi:hypothetical protein